MKNTNNDLSIEEAVKKPIKNDLTEIEFYFWKEKKKKTEKIQSSEKKGSEDLVKTYFESQGFLAFNVEPQNAGRHSGNGFNDLPPSVRVLVNKHPLVESKIIAGFPDIVVYDTKENSIFYVEVKKGNDSLRKNQFDFLLDSPHRSFVAWVTNRNEVTEYNYKCPRCKEVYANEEKFENHSCKIEKSESGLSSDSINWGAYGYANPKH